MTTPTLTKRSLGYDVEVDGVTVGSVRKQGQKWTYTLSEGEMERMLELKPRLTRRDLMGCLGGYTREDSVRSLLRETRP